MPHRLAEGGDRPIALYSTAFSNVVLSERGTAAAEMALTRSSNQIVDMRQRRSDCHVLAVFQLDGSRSLVAPTWSGPCE